MQFCLLRENTCDVNVNKNCDKAKKKKWNVGKPTLLPLNENVVYHRRSCCRPTLT